MCLAPPRQLSKTFQPTSGNLLAPLLSLSHSAPVKILQGTKETELTQNERTCCLGYFGLLRHCSAPSTDWLLGAEAARYWGKAPFTSLSSPALQSPPERKLPGTGWRQWNADVGKSWRKMLESTALWSVWGCELLAWVKTLSWKCSLKAWLVQIWQNA